MNDEENVQNVLIQFPCEIPVFPPFKFDAETGNVLIESTRNFVALQTEGQVRIPTFTDTDLAVRFIIQQNKCGMMILVKIETMLDLLRMLEHAEKLHGGVACALFDPAPPTPGWPVPRADLAKLCE